MQKLVKRKMHYETIMPVEAYECEDERVEDYYFWTIFALSTTPVVGPVVGPVLAVADHYYHDEMVDAFVDYSDREIERIQNEVEGNQAVVDAAIDGVQELNEAAGNVIIDFVGSIDHDDPIVQLYGE
ncbi:MAG: hypothetical protein OXH16_01900 [Gemmatimonadetes bacterium]|nr:hypothetical protein [Gemmatimonadota bacterium]